MPSRHNPRTVSFERYLPARPNLNELDAIEQFLAGEIREILSEEPRARINRPTTPPRRVR